ncbi:type I glyceraldehyde-3-phosphate dehydrogenase [Dethiosulfovibrio sp. F2B]|uniref:type I glyceraldehyde-3-phosphate dehydrogenase n=1 Tax=Dethiosulfovibrio faecalis TaxID=2720018 RepID=UPI001F3DE4D8|nr:type I glyceraldehyde-3-phosphate dehydrogenase [Dethiosulfovibrio faecalis]MCF4150519.1 type I glyceraldehyde-3-phosphate dehydrogenase [Dethiosulfovibrio faecalis]
MSKVKVAINGFGRIGRLVLRALHEYDQEGLIDIVATNSRSTSEQRAYLFKYDSVHRRYQGKVDYDDENIFVDGKAIATLRHSTPDQFNWGDLGVDIVIEASGIYKDTEKAQAHLEAGAKKVVITAPGSGEGLGTFVMGVNEGSYDPATHHIVSNASCTTNCLAPVAKILNDEFNIVKGVMTTVHAYTGDQKTVDSSHKKFHRGRAAAVSMVPTSTGAAKAVGLVIPELKGKLNGMALRVPTPNVSVVDLVVELPKSVTTEEINSTVKKYSEGSMSRYLGYETDDCVSMDFVHDSRSSIFAPNHTMAIDNMVKVLSWYDNEWGYSCRCLDLVNHMIRKGL